MNELSVMLFAYVLKNSKASTEKQLHLRTIKDNKYTFNLAQWSKSIAYFDNKRVI
mgnify:CR=1 FL=1